MCGRPSMLLLLVLLLSAAAAASSAETDADCDAASNADLETQLRIAQIKEEILRRLKLSEAPVVNASLSAAPHSLPAPLAHLAPAPPPSSSATPRDDVTVDKVILFPVHQGNQAETSPGSSLRFRFQLPGQLEAEELSSAELWLHKQESSVNSEDFLISELSDNGTTLFMQKITIDGRWAYADIGPAMRRWLGVHPKGMEIFSTVYVSCSTCKIGSVPPISSTAENRPFLVLSINSIVKNDSQNKTVLPSCCTPHRYGNLQIIYRIGSQLVKATLKDMTVEECKCS
ncbi:uncharacterized protein LOC111050928 isoform X3 [Nilaparvata lugens]|uniref:uncharacterized protein LOC111050928 isoform X3 n=1 Tax=Nilaparvata lugens TaxID=108931 RepID=UPI00193E5B22|nr:uncharacterized protein LOC111050928 isoform X3 [Nilaparvata lugens]